MAKMERPHNILNSAPDADRRLNTNIKGLVFWWSGVTLFYLCSGLKISEGSSFLGIKFEKPSEQTFEPTFEQKFLIGLLILNAVFWVRLIWRILISIKYNKFYDEAVENTFLKERPKIGTVEKLYEEKMRGFNRFEKWGFGLLIPLVLGFVAIVCLSHRITLTCSPWSKIAHCFEFVTLYFVVSALFFVCVELYCEYCRETEIINLAKKTK